jgi:ABC-2 type transport system permease protein
MNAVRYVLAGFGMQLAVSRRSPAQFLVLVTAPLFSAIFLSIVRLHGESGHVANAVIGPGLIGLWAISLDVAASVLSEDRFAGRLELLLGAPAPLSMVVLGRILAVSVAGMLTFVESWLVARVGFGLTVPIERPLLAAGALAATCLATAGTATALAGAFMLSRNLHVYQNSMSYPIYILGGVVVPIATLPGWLGPLSKVVYLSWGAGLLRDAASSASPGDVAGRFAMLLLLGLIGFAVGVALTNRIRDRLRRTASAALA